MLHVYPFDYPSLINNDCICMTRGQKKNEGHHSRYDFIVSGLQMSFSLHPSTVRV